MIHLGQADIYCAAYGSSGVIHFEAHKAGRRIFIEITPDYHSNPRQDPMVVELVPATKERATYEERRAADAMEGLAARLDGLFRFQRDPSGLLVPDLDGATLIVDKPGHDSFQALDSTSGKVETVDKAALEVRGGACACALIVLMNKGCQCGAMGRAG